MKEKEKATRSSASSAPKRTRKKRKKKKTPKTSSSRAVRTQKSGHSSTSSSWYVYSGGVMSSVAFGSSILLGIYRLLQHSAITVLDCAYSLSYGVKVATFIWTWWRTRVVLPSMLAGFAGYDEHRAVFPSFVALADEARGDSTGAVLVQGDMPVVIASGAFDQTAQKTVEIPQLPFVDEVVHISCRSAQADSHGLALQQTMVIPQFQFLNEVIDVPVVQVARVPPCLCVAIPQVQFLDTLVTRPLLSTTGAWGLTVPFGDVGKDCASLSLVWCSSSLPDADTAPTARIALSLSWVLCSWFLGCWRGEDSRVHTWRRRSRSHSCSSLVAQCLDKVVLPFVVQDRKLSRQCRNL